MGPGALILLPVAACHAAAPGMPDRAVAYLLKAVVVDLILHPKVPWLTWGLLAPAGLFIAAGTIMEHLASM